jgi:hypothetical protein
VPDTGFVSGAAVAIAAGALGEGACIIAEPCGLAQAIGLGAVIGLAAITTQVHQMGRVQDNEWSRAAKEWARRKGGDPCEFLAAAKKGSQQPEAGNAGENQPGSEILKLPKRAETWPIETSGHIYHLI